jgi:hypothetical protein
MADKQPAFHGTYLDLVMESMMNECFPLNASTDARSSGLAIHRSTKDRRCAV